MITPVASLISNTAAEVVKVAYLFLPLLGGAILVALATRNEWLACLAGPVDHGCTLRGRRLCGQNKTLRGVLAGTLGTVFAMVLQGTLMHAVGPLRSLEYADYSRLPLVRLGFTLGLARMLSELPNSLVKRQLGIPPGALAAGPLRAVFFLMDHVDYLPGAWLVFGSFVHLTARRFLLSFAVVLIGHHLVSALGYGLRLRRSLH